MGRNLFELLCDELAYDRTTVLAIRVNPQEASVSWTEPSGMPRSTAHRFEETGPAGPGGYQAAPV